MLVEIENTNFIDTSILFLDASDEELVARYKETRRTHPMAMDGLVTEGIRKERAILNDLKTQASLVIDTTTLTLANFVRKSIILSNQREIKDFASNLFLLASNMGCQSIQTSLWMFVSCQTHIISQS